MEVAFEPFKKLSFRSYMQYETPEAFAKAIALSVPPGTPAQISLHWANGILFRFGTFSPTDSVVKEYIAGNLIWDHIDFAPMPKYTEQIRPPDYPMITITVRDLSKHTLFGPLAEWIRDNLIKKRRR